MNECLSWEDLYLIYIKQKIQIDKFYRLAIMGYQYGDIQKAIVYKSYYGSEGYHTELKLALADLIAQIHIFCLNENIHFLEVENLGLERLKEFCLKRMKKGEIEK